MLKDGLKSNIEYRYNDFFNVNLCPNVLIFCKTALIHVDCSSFKSDSFFALFNCMLVQFLFQL